MNINLGALKGVSLSRICDLDIHVFKCLYLLKYKVYESETQYAHWAYSGEHVVKIRRRGLNRKAGNAVIKVLHLLSDTLS